ncbi:MAG TPA: hypothetical protein VJ768_01765, partial [Anaerolineales bacterium]|nr:hypothetical protein [Anaerolineales bacterium]
MDPDRRFSRTVSLAVLTALVLAPAGFLLARQSLQLRAESESRRAAEAGNFDLSFRKLAIAAAFAPDPENYWSPIGELALKAGDPYTAVYYLKKAQAEDLLDGEGWKALAAAYLDTGEKDLGAQALSRALELGGPDPATLGQLVALQIGQGDYLAAAELLGALVELPQVDIAALKRHALLLTAVNPEEAVPLLSRLEAEIPEEAAIFREIGLSIRRAR